jgi:hypothetical protein
MIPARSLATLAAATALTLGLAGLATGANPGNPLGTAAFEGAGTSVADPGTGKLESLLPIQSLTGASHTYAGADLQRRTSRSNAGGAMADTLMAVGTSGLTNGAQLHVANADATASLTLTAGTGTTIEATGSLAIGPGRDVWLAYDATATAWRVVDNSAGTLLATNNLADVSSVSAAQANLGLATVSVSGSASDLETGTLDCSRMPSLVGDVTTASGSCSTSLKPTGVSGTYTKVTTDEQGRVTEGATLSVPDVPNLSGIYCALSGCNLSGQLVSQNGSALTPAFGIGSTTDGFYQLGSHAIGVSVNGSNAGVLDMNGRLTLGSTSNQALLGKYSVFEAIYPNTEAGFSAIGLNTPGNLFLSRTSSSSCCGHAQISPGVVIGNINFGGDDGSSYGVVAGSITAFSEGSISAAQIPGQICINTASLSGVNTIGLCIGDDQSINVGSSGSTKIADATGNIYGKSGLFSGSAVPPTLAVGSAEIYGSLSLGAVLSGQGSGADVTLANDSGLPALSIMSGTTTLKIAGASSWSTNGPVATTCTGVGPSGSHATIQEWLTIIDSAGTTRYIPAF